MLPEIGSRKTVLFISFHLNYSMIRYWLLLLLSCTYEHPISLIQSCNLEKGQMALKYNISSFYFSYFFFFFLTVSLFLSLSLSLYKHMCIFLSHSLSLLFSLSLSLSPCLFLSLSLSLPLTLSLSLSPSPFFFSR